MSEFDWQARASEIAQAPVTPTPTEPDSWLIEDLGFFFSHGGAWRIWFKLDTRRP
jgi:hypothetical protein